MDMNETMSELEWLRIFARNLRSYMGEYGYTQGQLADCTGLTQGAISNYVNARRMPSIKAIINIACELNVDLEDFLYFGSRID